ncbi:hypothetical protein CgunFtcFv8_000718 [Champsocephalus gunnari]|uniref:SAM domain-containing protein n=1 Tax=Champsocephalus gunnari TaxID=52237 RepID=A0AAN8DKT4_CHAGU|nr:hypothetical protein CgunFtcFv8_000718 [Champsocephalus gunnari]
MSGEDMFEYLKEKGFEMWPDTFKEKSVIKLRELNDDDFMAEMGKRSPEDRQKILDSILKIWPVAPKVFNDPIHGKMIKPPKTQEEVSQSSPQYKERLKKKSFLYEFVANERNGIDVDKFDYFARDCHHLGIKNNFDHGRFIKFARVCEVDGQKHICTRDKEENNLDDLFHTREATEILKNVVDRKHYRCLGEIKHEGILSKDDIPQLRKDLARDIPREGAQADGLTEEDFVVLAVTMDYGRKEKDPIDSMDFYSKKNPTKAIKIKREQVSNHSDLSETLVRVYSKKIDPKSLEAARVHFERLNPVWSDSHVKVS